MSKADRTIACWMCLVGLLLCAIIAIMRYAASQSISAAGAGFAFVAVAMFSLSIGAILFGLATERI